MGKLLVLTPVHGYFSIVEEAFKSIDNYVPALFTHLIIDDYSEENDALAGEKYREKAGPIIRDGEQVGERIVLHSKELGATESPNITLIQRHAFDMVREDKEYEGLLFSWYNTLLYPETVAGFQKSAKIHGLTKAGCVVPIYATPDGTKIESFGGHNEHGY